MSYRVRNPDLHQEEDTISIGYIALAAVVIVVVSGVMIVWALSEVNSSNAELRPSHAFSEQWLGPRHTVQNVRQDVFDEQPAEGLHAAARRELNGYGYVDKGAGVVHIPIDRAIDLVAAGRRP